MRLLGREYKKFPYEIKREITKRNLHFKDLMRLGNQQNLAQGYNDVFGANNDFLNAKKKSAGLLNTPIY